MTDNQELVLKTLTTTMLTNGGQLNPEQQDEFVRLVRDTSVLLARVRFVEMAQSLKLIDRLHVGEPITRGATEDTPGTPLYRAKAKASQIRLEAHKLKSDWAITTEILQENIENGNFEDAIMQAMAKRISSDLEILAVQGDVNFSGTGPLADLLPVLDGWDKKTNDSNIVDANGGTFASLGTSILAEAVNAMPEQYLQDPDLVWVMSRPLATDWQTFVAQRETAAGDDALRGNTLRPYGFPVLIVPSIPSRKAITQTGATPARVAASLFGPYELTSSNNVLVIEINGTGAETLTLPVGTWTVVELAGLIRAALPGAKAALLKFYDDGLGRLVIETKLAGATAAIIIGASTLDAELGITEATYSGLASAANVFYKGSFILLCNLKNLIAGMVDETRVYTEFNKDNDRLESVVYNQLAVNVENLEAIVKIVNIART